MRRLFALSVAALVFVAQLSPATARAQRTAALMPQVNRPAGFTEAQVDALREAATRALRESSYRVMGRREVASRLATGMRCRPTEPCLQPAHAALGVELLVHLSIQGSLASPNVVVQLTDGSQRVRHRLDAPAAQLQSRVHDTVLRAARRVQLARR